VVQAFRVGVHVAAMAQEMTQAAENPGPWAVCVDGLDAKKAAAILDKFHKEKVSKGGL
jgi:hypothetical protein